MLPLDRVVPALKLALKGKLLRAGASDMHGVEDLPRPNVALQTSILPGGISGRKRVNLV